ncbi:putative RNA-directed DNA polymerase, eukaryota, reverse transcriptase zinc-binding domain protein [Tanacetum coccineum]
MQLFLYCPHTKKRDPIDIKDFRPISLLGCQYKVIAKVLANRLQQVVHSVISDVQTAYLQGRQIIDGPLIVNEVISWATKNKERLFILKVDFEKAFDSLDWNFLDHTMEQMGFSSKWRKWIRGCLNSAYASVLVNGSPTKEFKICKGLRQGDPVLPFLFIIAAEALHVTIEEAKAKRLFEGVKVGDNSVDLSHLQFADDALLLGKWSLDNARNLCRILRCFNMASGLKVNFSKSKFFGIGVTRDEFTRKAVDGFTFMFWNDIGWVGSSSHQHVYFWDWRRPIRDGRERTQLDELLNVLSNVALTASPDGWIFNSNDSTSFSTSEMRYIIDSSFLYSSGVPIHWNKNLPIKINIHSWRLSLNRLPTQFNLDRHGIDFNSVRCLVCDSDIETDLHLFLKCPIAISIWNSISRWWSIGDFSKDINCDLQWIPVGTWSWRIPPCGIAVDNLSSLIACIGDLNLSMNGCDNLVSTSGAYGSGETSWKTFGGNTRDLGLILKKPDKMIIWLEDGLKNQDQSVETAPGKLVTPSKNQASNWLERLPTGSISTWEDLTTRFLAQFFPPGRTFKLCNDILMFQQHQGESLSEAWTRFNDLLQNVAHRGIDLWL